MYDQEEKTKMILIIGNQAKTRCELHSMRKTILIVVHSELHFIS